MYVKMKVFEQNDPTGRFRNWMEDKAKDYNESINPFADFLIPEANTEALKPKKKGRRVKGKPSSNPPLDDVMEDK